MFFLLLPAGIWCAALLETVVIRRYQMDDRDAAGPCILFAFAPFALVGIVWAFIVAIKRDGGGKALYYALFWNFLLVAGIGLALVILSRMH